MKAEEYHHHNFRSRFNTMDKRNRSIQQFDFYDMVDFANAFARRKLIEYEESEHKAVSEFIDEEFNS